MKENNATLSIQQSMLLLNELYLDAKTKFVMKDALYGLELMEVELSEKVDINIWVKPKDIEEAYNKIVPKYAYEFPNKFDYFDIFLRSGFFFNNYYQKFFENSINANEDTNLLEGDLPVALAFDTNLYYNLFFDQLTELLRKRYGSPPYLINFLCSTGVKKELTGYEWKYKSNDIEEIKQISKDPDVIDNFLNQNKLRSRLWHLGHVDYLDSIDSTQSKIVDMDKTIETDDMDSKILEGLVEYINQQNIKLYLYSQDSDFISRAKGNRNVIPIYLDKIPFHKLNSRLSCEWEQFAKLLYVISITFGAIRLEFEDSALSTFGIWKGKKYHHWLDKSIKIVSKDNIITNIQKDLQILENIKFKEV